MIGRRGVFSTLYTPVVCGCGYPNHCRFQIIVVEPDWCSLSAARPPCPDIASPASNWAIRC